MKKSVFATVRLENRDDETIRSIWFCALGALLRNKDEMTTHFNAIAKTFFAAILATTALFAANASLFGADSRWILNNGPDAEKARVGQAVLRSEIGLTKIVATGTDATFAIPFDDDSDVFSAEERPFFALRYKITSTLEKGGLFYTTDELPNLSDKSYSEFPIESDGDWHNLVVDMRTFNNENWRGTVRSFRLDPTNPSEVDSTFELSRLGFFPTQEAADAFLNEANDAPNFALDTTFFGSLQRCVVPGGSLEEGYNRDDYLLKSSIDAKKIKAENIAPENLVVVSEKNGKTEIVPLCDTTRLGFTTFSVAKPGDYRLDVTNVSTSFPDVVGRASEKDVRFVLARKLMFGVNDKSFQPTRKLTIAEGVAILEKMKTNGFFDKELAARIGRLDVAATTREEAARALAKAIRKKIGTEFESEFASEYFTRDRIRLGAWGNFNPKDFNDEYMKTYRDCGFDFLLSMGGIPSRDLLALGNKYGVEVYLNDGGHMKPTETPAEYADYPSFTGHYVTDEPGSDSFDELAEKCNAYSAATGKTPYVNLLPMYANAAQLKYGAGADAIEYYDADPDLFRKYCESFCQKFNVKYICTDIYPLNWTDGKKTTYRDYVESINVIASVARRFDREFWCYIQTFAWTKGKRTPNEAEFRWQCYSMLSFGCKCILCWTYAGYDAEFPSLVDVESRKSSAWFEARPVFQELRRLSDEYVKFRNIGAFTHRCTDETPYLKMSDPCEFPTIAEIQCDDPLLIGCFEKKPGKSGPETAFILTNMSELEENRGTTVRVKLNGSKATAWYRGVSEKVECGADGYFEFHLASGEGVFVTVAK